MMIPDVEKCPHCGHAHTGQDREFRARQCLTCQLVNAKDEIRRLKGNLPSDPADAFIAVDNDFVYVGLPMRRETLFDMPIVVDANMPALKEGDIAIGKPGSAFPFIFHHDDFVDGDGKAQP